MKYKQEIDRRNRAIVSLIEILDRITAPTADDCVVPLTIFDQLIIKAAQELVQEK